MKKLKFLPILALLFLPILVKAQADFNPHYIISDSEMFDSQSWKIEDIQKFLQARGSYLANYKTEDLNGNIRTAAGIIYDSSQTYGVNPKFILVTLQKEQSLITDDSPTQRQLDWATGFAVCDSCSKEDPKVQKHKGFAKQIDDAAGIVKYYNDNKDLGFVKKKGATIFIDDTPVTPETWATAFLYTYTPHLHGNKNFWRIWETWFTQNYPNGTLVQASDASSTEIWLLQDGKKRKFKNMSVLISRADPKMIVSVPMSMINNYADGSEISLPNYSILKNENNQFYLLDYDALRPFDSEQTVRQLGYNPDEIIDVNSYDIKNYDLGPTISASSTAPAGVIYQITDLNNNYYLLKDNNFYPITDANLLKNNYKNIPIEKHKKQDLKKYTIIYENPIIKNGLLLKDSQTNTVYVIEDGKKRQIADNDSFTALGYKKENIVTVNTPTLLTIPDGEQLFVNASLLSSKDKFLGDSESEIKDLYNSKLPTYLVAEYPSGRIITGKNVDDKKIIASLTKLITALSVVSQKYKPEDVLVYDSAKDDIEGGNLNIKNGEKIKVKDAFNTMLVGSANNMARLLARYESTTETDFIKLMNRNLDTWGMDNTEVYDATGLNEKNVSTARDLLKIFVKAQKDTTIKTSIGLSSYTFNEVLSKDKTKNHVIKNTNKLVEKTGKNYKILASKTGYTEEAGSNLIMLIEGIKDKKQYVIITLGDPDYANRFVEPDKIAEWLLKQKF